MKARDFVDQFQVKPGKKVKLKEHDPDWNGTDEFKNLSQEELKKRSREILEEDLNALKETQNLLYADDRYALLVVFQALDAAGKDGTIKHVMSGVNPQGCQVFSFKKPTAEEYDHTFLWRYMRNLPERGRIGIFNRSYYEDVLVVKVHPELLGRQISVQSPDEAFWNARYDDINAFERHLVRNGTVVLKFFLNVSRKEQKKRFLERLERPEKNWKFSAADLTERGFWDDYMKAYEDALSATSTDWAPWYVIPADHKWVTRTAVASIITGALTGLNLKYPDLTKEQREELEKARKQLKE